jgi:D-amino peptidase
MEGVAGVMNVLDWVTPQSRYYETGKRLLTLEVNAVIDGLAQHGFDEIIVSDGHGAGAIDIELLDSRAKLVRGWPCQDGPYSYWPLGMDHTFDAIAYVGQHAKAGTEFSHMTHTGTWDFIDYAINGISICEYGQGAFAGCEFDIPVIFASGEKALCLEAEELTPWAVTAAVKEGNIGGKGDELDYEEYMHFYEGAIHLQPVKARELIKEKASQAGADFQRQRQKFKPLKLKSPYEVKVKLRRSETRKKVLIVEAVHQTSISGAFNNMIKKLVEINK